MKYLCFLCVVISLMTAGCVSSWYGTDQGGGLKTEGKGQDTSSAAAEKPSDEKPSDPQAAELSKQLLLAIMQYDLEKIASLIDKGADPNLPVYGFAYREEKGERIEMPLYPFFYTLDHREYTFDQKEKILSHLVRGGVDVNAVDDIGYTALDYIPVKRAAFEERYEKLNWLLENGADPNMPPREIRGLSDDKTYYIGPFVTDLVERDDISGEEKVKFLRLLARHGADFNIPDHRGNTPLYNLARYSLDIPGRAEIIRALLEGGADPDIQGTYEAINQSTQESSFHREYPLRAVLKNSGLDEKEKSRVVRVFLEGGADPNVADEKGYTFFHSLCSTADLTDYKELIRLSLRMGADPVAASEYNTVPLETLFRRKDSLAEKGIALTDVLEIIEEEGVDLGITDPEGRNLLFYAAYARDFETAGWLVRKGVSPSIRDREGNTVIHALFESSKPVPPNMVRFFIKNGADINARGTGGNTVLSQAARRDEGYDTLRLLVELGAEINISNDNEVTPYGIALQLGKTKNAEYLKSLGGVPYVPQYPADNRGRAAQAVLSADFEALRSIPAADLEQIAGRSANGVPATPLHLAVESGDRAVVKALINRNVDWNVKDRYGRSPLDYAVQAGRADLADELLRAGADPNFADDRGVTPFARATNLYPDMAKSFLNKGYLPDDAGPMVSAVWTGNLGLVKAYAPYTEMGAGAVNFAADFGRVEIVKYLTTIVELTDTTPEEAVARAEEARRSFTDFGKKASRLPDVPRKSGGIAGRRGAFTWTVESYAPWTGELTEEKRLEDFPVGVYVPESYDGSKPYGLLVSMIYAKSTNQYPRPGFQKILDAYNIIWVGFDPYNGLFVPFDRNHEIFSLAVVYNILGYYNIDRDRVYLAGFSWGGRLTGEIVPRQPHIFTGGLAIDGCFTTGERLLPGLEYGKKNIAMVMATGDFDYNRMETYNGYSTLLSMGYRDCLFIQQPRKGHAIISAENFEKAIKFLDDARGK